jgi:hypothetical protein
MPNGKTSEAEAVYERVEELKRTGLDHAEAVRAVAEERGKKENAVRTSHYRYRVKTHATSLPRASRNGRETAAKPVSVDDAVSRARSVLEGALDAVNREASVAKEEIDAAQARYDQVLASVEERRAILEQKIAALA